MSKLEDRILSTKISVLFQFLGNKQDRWRSGDFYINTLNLMADSEKKFTSDSEKKSWQRKKVTRCDSEMRYHHYYKSGRSWTIVNGSKLDNPISQTLWLWYFGPSTMAYHRAFSGLFRVVFEIDPKNRPRLQINYWNSYFGSRHRTKSCQKETPIPDILYEDELFKDLTLESGLMEVISG